MKKITLGFSAAFIALSMNTYAQTNVFDDVIAISPVHTSLKLALETANLDDDLQDPMMSFTVFAPTNQAFDDAVTALGLADINALLALPNLADILLYHVLDSEVPSMNVSNGLIATPMNTSNTLKFTVDGSNLFANQAPISIAGVDLTAGNGRVHVLDAIVLPVQTVADVAIGSALHTSLVAAVVEARLLPALTNPFTQLTVFAPTNPAFSDLATALNTDLNGILAHPQLEDILLYHVVAGAALSGDLSDGPLTTLNGQSVTVDLSSGVMINTATVTTPNTSVYNGVVHIIDAVLVPSLASLEEEKALNFNVYPNPATDFISIDGLGTAFEEVLIMDLNGRVLIQSTEVTNSIDVNSLENGTYIIGLRSNDQMTTKKLSIN